MKWRQVLAAPLFCLAAGCGGVSYHLDGKVAVPGSVAVLPIGGPASPGMRDAARSLIFSRLQSRGYLSPEPSWVDGVLAQHGWLTDPEHFDASALPLTDVAKALAVDAVLAVNDLDERRFSVFLLLRRHRVSGSLAVTDTAGNRFWSADHGVGSFHGLLIGSGQALTEVRGQFDHATPMASLAMLDQWVDEVIATVPAQQIETIAAAPPAVREVRVLRSPAIDGTDRLEVRARATQGAVLQFDLPPDLRGVPMIEDPPQSADYVGVRYVPAAAANGAIVVRARDAFGREASQQERP